MADEAGVPVTYLRTLDDSVALKERLTGRIVVVGAGWIGLEVAAAAREAGAEVTVVEQASQPLEAVLGPEIGAVFADLHREHGVDLRLGTSVDTETLAAADLVVVGIGATPDDDLARAAGLACDNGVLVDARLRASDPHVFAAGDVARQDHPLLGRLRVEHWDAAIHQGKAAARAMLGDDAAYDRMPYFFTDQYDLGMEYVGHTGAGYDEVVVRRRPRRAQAPGVLAARRDGAWPACTSTTGTRSTRSGRWWVGRYRRSELAERRPVRRRRRRAGLVLELGRDRHGESPEQEPDHAGGERAGVHRNLPAQWCSWWCCMVSAWPLPLSIR